MRLVLAAAAFLAIGLPARAAEQAPMPDWMAGAWTGGDGQSWLDETWSSARGGTMFGSGRVGSGDAVQFWEVTRIERQADGSLSYIANPRGEPGAAFGLTAWGPQSVEFANPAHDYPQRIRYWREGDRLLAQISLLDGSKAERFEYTRAGN